MVAEMDASPSPVTGKPRGAAFCTDCRWRGPARSHSGFGRMMLAADMRDHSCREVPSGARRRLGF